MFCAQDDRKLRIIALLVDTPGYDELMVSKSAVEQLAEKTELAKHLRNVKKSYRNKWKNRPLQLHSKVNTTNSHCA